MIGCAVLSSTLRRHCLTTARCLICRQYIEYVSLFSTTHTAGMLCYDAASPTVHAWAVLPPADATLTSATAAAIHSHAVAACCCASNCKHKLVTFVVALREIAKCKGTDHRDDTLLCLHKQHKECPESTA